MAIYNSQEELISTLVNQSRGTAMESLVQGQLDKIVMVDGDGAEFDPLTGNLRIGQNNPMALAAFVHEYTHKMGWSSFQAAMDDAMIANDRDRAILLASAFEAKATAAEALYLGTEGLLSTLGAGGEYMQVGKLIELYQFCASETGYSKQNQEPVQDMYQCLVDGVAVQMPYVFSAAYADAYRSQWDASNGGNGGGYGGGGGAGWGGFFPDYSGLNSVVIKDQSSDLALSDSVSLNITAVANNEGATLLVQALASFMADSEVGEMAATQYTKAGDLEWQLAVV